MCSVWSRIARRHLPIMVVVLSATAVALGEVTSNCEAVDMDYSTNAVSFAQVRMHKTLDGVQLLQSDGFEITKRMQAAPGSTELEAVIGDALPDRESIEVVDEGQDLAEPANLSIGLLMARMIHKGLPKHRIDHLNSVGQKVEYNGLYEQAITFPVRRPWTTNLVIATLKTFSADFVVQASSPRDASGARRFDWRRSLLFTTFGFLYIGMAQWFFYISMFSRLCPEAINFASESLAVKLTDTVGQEDLAIQVFVDLFIISPFIYFPIFYTLKEFLKRFLEPCEPDRSEKNKESKSLVMQAMTNYGNNFVVDNMSSVSLWLPADIVVFMAPMFLRMPLDHAFSFGWTIILSYMRGGTK